MKIAYVLSIFPKLSESFILNEIVELLKKGHDAQIFSIYKPIEDILHEEVNKYRLLERTHYFRRNQIFAVIFFKLLKYFLKAFAQDLSNLELSKNYENLNLNA